MKFEFSQLLVLSTVYTFALVDGESDDGLVVLDGGEGSFLDTWDGGVSWYDYILDRIFRRIPIPKMFPSIATPILNGVTSNNKRPSVFSLPA